MQKEINSDKKNSSQAHNFAIGETCFIIMPFIVMTIIFAFKHKLEEMLFVPEWSLAASVMFGQTIIKIIHSIGKYSVRYTIYQYRLGMYLSFIIIIGLVPSLVILSIINSFNKQEIPNWIYIIQIILFIIATVIFYLINGLQVEQEEDEAKKN